MPCEQVPEMTPLQIFKQVSRYAIAQQPRLCVISPAFPGIRIMFSTRADGSKGLCIFEPNGAWLLRYNQYPSPCITLMELNPQSIYGGDSESQLQNGPAITLTNYRDLDDFVSGIDQAVRGARHG